MSSWPRVDFSPRSTGWARALGHETSRGVRAAYLLAASISVAWATWQFLAWQRVEQENAELRERVAHRQPATAPAPLPPRQAWSANQLRAAADVIARLNTDWPQLLDELERLTPRDVAVLEIEPRPGQAALTLTIETRTAQDAWRYVDALNQSTYLHHVRALKHETNDRDPNRPVRFSLSAAIGSPP
ncbi:PilN domain-containing protein [Ideonella sp. DXS29W]|uniref:PilN domain-containing protein n=1 Tax=Ideonella lacteola TaxID=2984193 RepID=A0ABU9BNM2_9BURK